MIYIEMETESRKKQLSIALALHIVGTTFYSNSIMIISSLNCITQHFDCVAINKTNYSTQGFHDKKVRLIVFKENLR